MSGHEPHSAAEGGASSIFQSFDLILDLCLYGAGLATGIQGIYNWNSIFVVNLFSESHRKTDVCVMSIIFQ